MIPAHVSLDSIVQYMSVELKLIASNEAHIEDGDGHRNYKRRHKPNFCAMQKDPTVGGGRSQDPESDDGNTSSGGECMTGEDHENAHTSLPSLRKLMVMTRRSGEKYHPVKERCRGEWRIPC